MTHKTAISRTKLSAPMQWLNSQGMIQSPALDYGCGKGYDAAALKLNSYDPYYKPELPKRKYRTITCNYVLNVISSPVVRAYTIGCMVSFLKPGGTLYVTVRADVAEDGYTSKGWQGDIDVIAETAPMTDLDVTLIRQNSGHRIYRIKKV